MDQNKVTYNGLPVVRCGNEMYYGNMTDKYITLLRILSSHEAGGVQIADKVEIRLLFTDPDIKGKSKIVKTSERESLSLAFELAVAWLGRYNAATAK